MPAHEPGISTVKRILAPTAAGGVASRVSVRVPVFSLTRSIARSASTEAGEFHSTTAVRRPRRAATARASTTRSTCPPSGSSRRRVRWSGSSHAAKRCRWPPRRPRSGRGRRQRRSAGLQDPRLRQVQIQEQKKKNEARKKQKVIEVKEIKMRPGIDDHDYEVKMRAMTASSRKATRSRSPCASAAARWCTRSSA